MSNTITPTLAPVNSGIMVKGGRTASDLISMSKAVTKHATQHVVHHTTKHASYGFKKAAKTFAEGCNKCSSAAQDVAQLVPCDRRIIAASGATLVALQAIRIDKRHNADEKECEDEEDMQSCTD